MKFLISSLQYPLEKSREVMVAQGRADIVLNIQDQPHG